jgi:HK97 family phage major capsid protein
METDHEKQIERRLARMALKALMLKKRLEDKRSALQALVEKDGEFETREAELEASIEEAQTEEEKKTVEEEVGKFEEEKTVHDTAKQTLTGEIEQLEQDLEEEEARSAEATKHMNKPQKTTGAERKDEFLMHRSKRGFLDMTMEQRSALVGREEVKTFLSRVRELGGEKRAVSGGELTIPDVMLDLVRENISKYSKLMAYVNLRPVPGTARQNIMGTVPEAIWTEACGKLNELNFYFNQVEVDGYKVGGYVAICNATKEDSDLNLVAELLDGIGQAIGYAVDKAIVYGTGKKMPMGVATRLAQTAKPSSWPENGREWKDLSSTNLIKISGKTGLALYQAIVLAASATYGNYSVGNRVWIMSETTRATLVSEAMAFNSGGAIVSGLNNTMPVVGGDIVTLDFIPDGDIVVGYFALYLLAQRAGTTVAESEHVRFIEDQTVLKGTARYDGLPVIDEAFAVINIKGEAPTTSATFAPDTANTAEVGED